MTISVENDIAHQDGLLRWWRRAEDVWVKPADDSDAPRVVMGTIDGDQQWPVYGVPVTLADGTRAMFLQRPDDPDPETFVTGDVALSPNPFGNAPGMKLVHRADFERDYVECEPMELPAASPFEPVPQLVRPS